MLPDHSPTLETENTIPTHAELNLDPLQCRSSDCLKMFSQEHHRKRHEQEKHKMFEKRGRTVSPIPLSASASAAAHVSVSRPQSCPPPTFDSTFLTPERPSRKRRRISASSTSSLIESPTTLLTPPSSPLPSPTMTLTPNSSDFSSSETEDETSGASEKYSHECQTCLVNFKNKKDLKYQHKCNFRYDPLSCRSNNIFPVFLTPPKHSQETLQILSQLCSEDLVKLCMLQGWCVPNVYP